jgi:ammonium transporter, Amt family
MNILGKLLPYFSNVDDSLQVFHTHLVGGFVGGLLTGIFATAEACAAAGAISPGGVIAGNPKQLVEQIIGFLFIVGWNLVWTSLICLFIKYVCRMRLRYDDDVLRVGDASIHGEAAYSLQDNTEEAIGLRYMDSLRDRNSVRFI